MPRALRYGAAWAAEVAHRLTSVAAMATRVLFMGPPSEGRRRSEKAPFEKLRRRGLGRRMCEALSKVLSSATPRKTRPTARFLDEWSAANDRHARAPSGALRGPGPCVQRVFSARRSRPIGAGVNVPVGVLLTLCALWCAAYEVRALGLLALPV